MIAEYLLLSIPLNFYTLPLWRMHTQIHAVMQRQVKRMNDANKRDEWWKFDK